MIDAAPAAPEQPTQPAASDVLNLWEFFQEFIAENRISLTLHGCHREICDMYEAAITGEMPGYEYFVVNMPRRTGKTKILEALPIWIFGEFGDAQMLYGSYSDKLVLRTLSNVQRWLQRQWYRDLYGDVIHGKRADLVTTAAGGSLYGAGMGATIAGFGAGLKEPGGGCIALDDPAKPDFAMSKVETENTIENFETTWKGCRNSDKWTPILINAQRIGTGDLPDYVETTYRNKTFTLKFPCMVGGLSMFPETWSTSTLLDLQKTRTGRFVLATQFNQESALLAGNLIQIDTFHRWNPATPIKFERTVITCDTALKTKQVNDFSAVALWGLFEKKAYLVDLMHGKWETPDLITNCAAFWAKWTTAEAYEHGIRRPRFIIEEKAAGTPLLQSLRRPPTAIPATGIERDIDKVRRVKTVMPHIETGMVVVPQDNSTPWIDKFLTECAGFKDDGTAAHDDMVDTMVDAIEYLLGRGISVWDNLGGKKS